MPRDIAIFLGAHKIRQLVEPGKATFAVEEIHIHDNWNPHTAEYDGDIAVIKLTEKVFFNTYIRPVCLPNEQVLSIFNGTVVGWGVHDDTDITSNFPRKLEMSILDRFECVKKKPKLLPIFASTMFCAGKDEAGVCGGDSGSGFYVEQNGKFHLRGIVSASIITSCSSSNYALYSDVTKYLKFINKVRKRTLKVC